MKSTDKMLNKRRMHPNSLANLRPKPFQPGVSANPAGRPSKADCLISCIKEELGKISFNGVLTNEQLIASVLVAKGTGGDMRAIELLAAYTTPKPTASIALGNLDGTPLPQPSFLFLMPDGNRKSAQVLKDYVNQPEAKGTESHEAVDNNK